VLVRRVQRKASGPSVTGKNTQAAMLLKRFAIAVGRVRLRRQIARSSSQSQRCECYLWGGTQDRATFGLA
jgi:hypothetical protein